MRPAATKETPGWEQPQAMRDTGDWAESIKLTELSASNSVSRVEE